MLGWFIRGSFMVEEITADHEKGLRTAIFSTSESRHDKGQSLAEYVPFPKADRHDDVSFMKVGNLSPDTAYTIWHKDEENREVRYMGVWYYVPPANFLAFFFQQGANIPHELYNLPAEAKVEIHRFNDIHGRNFELFAEQYDSKNIFITCQRQALYVGGIEIVEDGITKAEITVIPFIEAISNRPFDVETWEKAGDVTLDEIHDEYDSEELIRRFQNMFTTIVGLPPFLFRGKDDLPN
jgi:hypothetical protein